MRNKENSSYSYFVPDVFKANPYGFCNVNPLPHMPILGSSNSAANKNMTSKI